jgi:hypothetical protein
MQIYFSDELSTCSRWKMAALLPNGMDERSDRIDERARDQEQNRPHQIVDLPSKSGRSFLHYLRLPEEYRTQKQNDRHRSHENRDQLVHGIPLIQTPMGQMIFRQEALLAAVMSQGSF